MDMEETAVPWYLPIKDAAKVSGIQERTLRDCCNGIDPPPMLRMGKSKRLVSMDGLRDYLKAREI